MFPLDKIKPTVKGKYKRKHLIEIIKDSRKLYKLPKELREYMWCCNTCETLINLKLTCNIPYCCKCSPIPDKNGMFTGHRANGRYCTKCGADMMIGFDNTKQILRMRGLL